MTQLKSDREIKEGKDKFNVLGSSNRKYYGK